MLVLISICMEHATGIEPAYSAWEADVLPLNYRCMDKYYSTSWAKVSTHPKEKNPFPDLLFKWWVLTGSNRRPPVRQTGALPAELNTQVECCYESITQ